ncbi:MAG TPA: 2-phospho-L-lactate guanylyltransferase [Actinopolymorphaceae bacterium]
MDAATNDRSAPDWALVVPVKRTAFGKSRLAPYVGRHRPGLAHAMALDTLQAALACSSITAIFVVTDDLELSGALLALGAESGGDVTVVPDEPDDGLNAALRHGSEVARSARPGRAVAAMSADLPALRPLELDRVLDAARPYRNAFVPDADGVGTTVYTAGPGAEFAPRFGLRSRWAHRASGAVELDVAGISSVRRDVDTESDLFDAVGIGVGARTRHVLASIGALL